MSGGPVVSNSSPLIALSRIGRIELLPGLLREVWIPPAVEREVFDGSATPDWIRVTPLTTKLPPGLASVTLGAGEIEAIALATEVGAMWLILDDLRRAASPRGAACRSLERSGSSSPRNRRVISPR